MDRGLPQNVICFQRHPLHKQLGGDGGNYCSSKSSLFSLFFKSLTHSNFSYGYMELQITPARIYAFKLTPSYMHLCISLCITLRRSEINWEREGAGLRK